MDYLREINSFERWLETNDLPPLSQLLWYRLMALCDRAGWPEWMAVDDQRLMGLIQSRRETVFAPVRDSLVEAGFLLVERGKKGRPSRYKMVQFAMRSAAQSVAETVVHTEAQSVVHTEAQSVAHTEVQSVVHTEVQTVDISSYPTDTQKTKTKTKTNNNARRGPPVLPSALTVGEQGIVRRTQKEPDRLQARKPDTGVASGRFMLHAADEGYRRKIVEGACRAPPLCGATHVNSFRKCLVGAP